MLPSKYFPKLKLKSFNILLIINKILSLARSHNSEKYPFSDQFWRWTINFQVNHRKITKIISIQAKLHIMLIVYCFSSFTFLAAPALHTAIDTPRMALAPSLSARGKKGDREKVSKFILSERSSRCYLTASQVLQGIRLSKCSDLFFNTSKHKSNTVLKETCSTCTYKITFLLRSKNLENFYFC